MVLHRAIIHPLEQLVADGARGVGVPQDEVGRRRKHTRNSALQCDVEEAVQQQGRPRPEPVLDSGLELARARDPLHDVRDVVQAEQRAPLDGDAGIGDVTRPTQVLPVPDEVVVDEQLGGEFRPRWLRRVQQHFP